MAVCSIISPKHKRRWFCDFAGSCGAMQHYVSAMVLISRNWSDGGEEWHYRSGHSGIRFSILLLAGVAPWLPRVTCLVGIRYALLSTARAKMPICFKAQDDEWVDSRHQRPALNIGSPAKISSACGCHYVSYYYHPAVAPEAALTNQA